jgi:hypothetical protein
LWSGECLPEETREQKDTREHDDTGGFDHGPVRKALQFDDHSFRLQKGIAGFQIQNAIQREEKLGARHVEWRECAP